MNKIYIILLTIGCLGLSCRPDSNGAGPKSTPGPVSVLVPPKDQKPQIIPNSSEKSKPVVISAAPTEPQPPVIPVPVKAPQPGTAPAVTTPENTAPTFVPSPEDSLIDYVADGCMTPVSTSALKPIKAFDAACFPGYTSSVQELVIPARVRDWGSQGKAGKPWRFTNDACNDFYASLQRRISEAVPGILQTPHDLFHAHLIGYGPLEDRLAMVFHAKEYPRDLEPQKYPYQVYSENFYSNSPSFSKRNFYM